MKSWKGEGNPKPDYIRGNGADDESARSNPESHGREAEVVGSGRNHRSHGPDHAAVAAALRRARLRRPVRLPQRATEPEADRGREAGKGAHVVSGAVFRLQRAALPRETARTTRHRAE